MNIDEFIKLEEDKSEKPLDNMVFDGGNCGIFRTIACIGDSLSSGEFEAIGEDGKRKYHDMFEYSWGQYIARMAGCKVYNFSRGGMTVKEYVESFADRMDYWNPDYASQAYIIALGVNDIMNSGREIGSVDDICLENYNNNKPTFAGQYGYIVQRYKEIMPDAKFFFMSMPKSVEKEERAELRKAHRDLLVELTKLFSNSYIIDLNEYGPVQDPEYKRRFYTGGHLNASGYILTAHMVVSYIDYIIRHNPRDFAEVGFIGTPYKYEENLKYLKQ